MIASEVTTSGACKHIRASQAEKKCPIKASHFTFGCLLHSSQLNWRILQVQVGM
jgi:hypothetical protein